MRKRRFKSTPLLLATAVFLGTAFTLPVETYSPQQTIPLETPVQILDYRTEPSQG
ncbi:hypothetical protein [Paludifilum halophilum]|uniref:hypothetical protein n=1 Tax=Paludifilum halophilum TaxID=1642702 RepID=UPI00146BBCE0|nr:hypothetical protein [Paludifilum halophilum]